MAKGNKPSSTPPPRMPGLVLVPTGETIVMNGKRCKILKLVREKEYK